MGALHRPTGPKPMDLKSILSSSSPLGEVFPNNDNNRNNTIDDRGVIKPLNNFPFKPSPRDETRFTKSGGKRRRQRQRKENDEEEEEAQQVPPPMFSTVKKKKRDGVFRVLEAPPPKYAEEDEEEEEDEEVIVLTARKKRKTKRKTTSSRFAIFDGGKGGGFDYDDEGKKKGDGRAAADAPPTATKKKKKRKFDDEEEDGGEMKKEEKEETIRRAVPATTKKNEKIKEDDDGNKTAKRRRRCSSSGAAATTDTNNNNTNNKNSNAEFEKKIELALEREKASGSGRDVMASKSGAIANSPPTAAAAALVPPPVMAGAAMVFDASKTATTDDVARMKKKPATKSYKNFASKKPPSNSSKGFPAFDVAAAVAKKKAQIEAAKVQVGFGSSARKPAGIDPIPTKKPVVSASGSFRLGVSSSSASKRAKSTISSSVGSPFEVQQQQPVSEFQKMIQKARENLESSKAAEMLRSPAPITTAAVAPSPAAVERSTQRSLKMSTPSSSFARAPSAGKHQRFTSPPSAAAAAAAAAPKAKVAASSVEQQQRKQPRQQAMPPPAASVKFPVNQTLVFAATNSGNGTGVVDIVAKAKEKTYDPSTAEKAKKKAKEMYDKKLLDAERKEKLGQLSALDATLSSKAPSGVRDLVPRSFASSHDDATAAGENKKKTASSTSSRVFGGAMTKAQKAHMAMEWEPL